MKIRVTTVEEVELDLSVPIYRKSGKIRLFFGKIWDGGSVMVCLGSTPSIELGTDARAYSSCESDCTEAEFLDAFNEVLSDIESKIHH